MDNLHDGCGEDGVVLEDGFSLGVINGVVAHQQAGDEFLQYKVLVVVGMFLEPRFQFIVALELEGAGGAHSAVGLGNHGVTGLVHEGLHLEQSLGALDLAGRGDFADGIVLLHLALVADGRHHIALDAGVHVEVRAQAGILLQPVLVVGLNPVNLAPLVGKPGHGTVNLVVVLQVVNLVIVRKTVPQLLGEIPIVGIGNTQHVHAIGLGPGAEMPVSLGEMGRDKY